MNKLFFLLNTLSGIGEATLKRLHKLNLFTLFDLITYAPRCYEFRGQTQRLNQLTPGELAGVRGEIIDTRILQQRTRILTVTLSDGTGLLELRFFHFYPNQLKLFAPGKHLYCFGEVRFWGRTLTMTHPEYSFTDEAPSQTTLPIYPLSEGLPQKRLHGFIKQALHTIQDEPELELLPVTLRERYQLCALNNALQAIHTPTDLDFQSLAAYTHPAQLRLSFEELLAHRLALCTARQAEPKYSAPQLAPRPQAEAMLLAALPFQPTLGQRTALAEIVADLHQTLPMQRLLQGDVGSGKTFVALAAAAHVVDQGYQVAFMAPTEILAVQVYEKAKEMLAPLGTSVALLSGQLTASAKKKCYQALEEGHCQLVVGTHALIQGPVLFQRLGLVIIDEQHRFGVEQRLSLLSKNKGLNAPHQLSMTATPIPRTLAMTLYSDLSISSLMERPAGRKPIKTALIAEEKRGEVLQRLRQACQKGEQAYWVCPLIEASDQLDAEAAEVTFKNICKALPELTIGMVHGRMKAAEKNAALTAFKNHTWNILVATTVIEVGVDVPEASIIIIENPERMGLSQLHQLRGRVGRGGQESACILLYQGPLGEMALARLTTLRDHQDGFYLAEKDLELRGPGEFLGTRQTGSLNFRFASLLRDQKHLGDIKAAADFLTQHHPDIVPRLIQRWFGDKAQFVKA